MEMINSTKTYRERAQDGAQLTLPLRLNTNHSPPQPTSDSPASSPAWTFRTKGEDNRARPFIGLYSSSSSESSSSASASQVRNGSAALRTFFEVARSTYFLLALAPHFVTTSSLTRS